MARSMTAGIPVARFFCFALVGSAGTAIQYAVLGAGVMLFAAPAAASSAFGYILGSFANYRLNYRFTFQCRGAHTTIAAKYYAVLTIGWLMNTVLMTLFVNGLRWDYWGSQVLATTLGLIWNFTGSNAWAFKQKSTLPCNWRHRVNRFLS